MSILKCYSGLVQAFLCIELLSFKSVICHEMRQWCLLLRVFEQLNLSKGSLFPEPTAWKKSAGLIYLNCSDIKSRALFVSLMPIPPKLLRKISSQTEQASENKACHLSKWPNDVFVNLKVLKLIWI